MAKFHLLHCVPNRLMHGLMGYLEIIQTVEYGLKQLGHQVTYAVNHASAEARNIVFGAQVLPMEFFDKLSPDTIIYNFEQQRGLDPSQIRQQVIEIAKKFTLWDYSAANLDTWKKLGREDVKLVPVGYAPVLTRIPNNVVQDIDVLIYGLSGEQRLRCFHKLSKAGLTTVFISGLYGEARDDLIKRSKLVLNINLYDFSKIFEIARVSYLLANRKAVVSVIDGDTFIESDVRESCIFVEEDALVDTCFQALGNPELRKGVEDKGFDIFSKRDIVEILRPVV